MRRWEISRRSFEEQGPQKTEANQSATTAYFTNDAVATVTLSGTVTTTITEADIVTGGRTIILTLSGDTWVASGTAFDAQRQFIIDGLDGV